MDPPSGDPRGRSAATGHEGALTYQPALDGVRALAVLAVLGFHLGFDWLSGGYLGVSLFFTLSGFLITSLLLVDHERHGRIRFSTFYERRLRRLMPAALLTIVAVAVLSAVGIFERTTALRLGLVGALAQVANWTELLSGRSYAELFSDPTPVAHFWSLSIEEQFYWLWPLTIAVLVARTQWVRRPSGLVLMLAGGWLVTSLSAPLTAAAWSNSAVYFATWTRASEILAGAVVAAAIRLPMVQPRTWWAWFAWSGVAVFVVASVLTPAGRGWPYEGALPLFGIVSAAVIAGLQAPGPLRRALGCAPLVWVGRRSYGIYLYHWPVILAIDERRTGIGGWRLHLVQVGVTLAISAISFSWFEQPIRTGRRLVGGRRTVGVMGAATLVSVGLVLGLVSTSAPPDAPFVLSAATTTSATPDGGGDALASTTWPVTTLAPSAPPGDVDGAAPTVEAPEDPVDATAPPGDGTTSSPPAPTVMAIFGDSVPAWLLRDAAQGYSNPRATLVNGALEACDGTIALPVARDRHGAELVPPDTCVEWDEWYPDVLERGGGEVALLMLGQAPVLDRFVQGRWMHPCESIEWYLGDLERRIAFLRQAGVEVVFALPARPGRRATFIIPDDQVQRMECIRAELTGLLERLEVAWIDLDEFFCPDDDCDAVRTRDGAHVDPELAPAMLDLIVDAALGAAEARGST